MTTRAYPGYGSKLLYSTDNVSFGTIAQLQKFSPSGSKQSSVDQTNILTAGNGSQPLAVRFDSGEIDLAGVLDPQNGSQLALGQLHANLTLAWWKVILSDGITTWTFQAYVSEYVPFQVQTAKALAFTARLRVVSALTGPLGTA